MHVIWAQSIVLWTGEYNKLLANILNYDNVLSVCSVSEAADWNSKEGSSDEAISSTAVGWKFMQVEGKPPV